MYGAPALVMDVARIKIITSHAIKKTGTLIVIVSSQQILLGQHRNSDEGYRKKCLIHAKRYVFGKKCLKFQELKRQWTEVGIVCLQQYYYPFP